MANRRIFQKTRPGSVPAIMSNSKIARFDPMHDFGYSRTRHAGGELGEVGGLIWRDEIPAFYAERVGPFTLDDELHASGRIAFNAAGSDSAVYLGWFDAESKKQKTGSDHEQPPRNLLALLIEGPSRIGHYFRPAYRTRDGTGAIFDVGPVILPDGRSHRWAFDYFPNESDGRGRIVIHFDGERTRSSSRQTHGNAVRHSIGSAFLTCRSADIMCAFTSTILATGIRVLRTNSALDDEDSVTG